MKPIAITPIGKIANKEENSSVVLDKKYAPALRGMDEFSHILVLWWCHELDEEEMRSLLETPRPYKNAPEIMGIFATRSPVRPNPIAVTTVQVLRIDHDNVTIDVPYIDANDGTPVLDIKPYTPSIDRIENPSVPAWCRHWPQSVEESGNFDWEKEFLFSGEI